MLARLDRIPGVDEARVDWTGARVLANADEHAAVEGWRRGESWMRTGEKIRLSREEARVLGERYAARAAPELELSSEQQRELAASFESALARVFERTHSSGTSQIRFELEVDRLLDQSRRCLRPEQVERLRGFLVSLDGPD